MSMSLNSLRRSQRDQFLPSSLPSEEEPAGEPLSCAQAAITTSGSTLFVAGASAGLYAACGAVGAAILNRSGYGGYHPAAAANIGAVGGAILGAAVGFTHGLITSCGVKIKPTKFALAASVGMPVIGGLIGYAVLNAHDAAVMTVGPVAAAFAVGSSVIVGSVLVCVGCCTTVVVMGATAGDDADSSV